VFWRLAALIGDDALGRRRARSETRSAASFGGGGKTFAALGHGDVNGRVRSPANTIEILLRPVNPQAGAWGLDGIPS
jgi:hypothetical protein